MAFDERLRAEIARRGQVHVAVEIVRDRMLSLVPARSFDPRVAIVDTPHADRQSLTEVAENDLEAGMAIE
jgi:hypothetical protein